MASNSAPYLLCSCISNMDFISTSATCWSCRVFEIVYHRDGMELAFAFPFAMKRYSISMIRYCTLFNSLRRWRDTVLYVNIKYNFSEVVSVRQTSKQTNQPTKNPSTKLREKKPSWMNQCCCVCDRTNATQIIFCGISGKMLGKILWLFG